jgi:enoyl-[acyl-carrier protein] reductase I
VRELGQLEEVFAAITQRWGSLDFGLHALAFARVTTCMAAPPTARLPVSRRAMDVSCHSFIRVAHMAEPLMRDGGALPFYGAERVVAHYNLIGPGRPRWKAPCAKSLPSSGRRHTRPRHFPGPIRSRAASAIDRFDERLQRAAGLAPERHLADIEDGGRHLMA